MLNKAKSILASKQAGGSLYLGVMLLIVCLVAVLMCINMFRLYTSHTRLQLICDAVADGSSIAGLTPSGFDERRMKDAARGIAEHNGLSEDNYTITVEDEIIRGSFTGNKLVTVEMIDTGSYYSSEFLNIGQFFDITARAVVRVKIPVVDFSLLNESYYDSFINTAPFVTTEPGNRNSHFITWLVNYYLCPEYNGIYEMSGAVNQAHKFLYDYLVCMGANSHLPVDAAEWAPFFCSDSPSGHGWTNLGTPEEIQAAADAGEVVVVVSIPSSVLVPESTVTPEEHTMLIKNNATLYVAIPNSIAVQDGCFTAATCGQDNSNGQLYDYNNMIERGNKVFAWRLP